MKVPVASNEPVRDTNNKPSFEDICTTIQHETKKLKSIWKYTRLQKYNYICANWTKYLKVIIVILQLSILYFLSYHVMGTRKNCFNITVCQNILLSREDK